MRTLIQIVLITAASATLFACKPKPAATEPVAVAEEEETSEEEGTATASAERVDACTITMTAPEPNEWTTYWESSGGGGSEAKSVHWANATEKSAQANNFLANPLEISCSSNDSPGISITLSASTSNESDVPMSPGSYPIWGKQQAALKAGQFLTATLMYDNRAFDSRSGTINVQRFDTEGVQGTFTLDGAEMPGAGTPIQIQGTFDIPCRREQMQSECASTKGEPD